MLARNRLKKASDFQRVYGARLRRDGTLVAVHSRPNQLAYARVGFSVSTKVGGSVVRNAVKRRLRAICRDWLEAGMDNGVDVVVVARPAAADASFDALSDELSGLLRGV
jgi:ribonuclease P protein component